MDEPIPKPKRPRSKQPRKKGAEEMEADFAENNDTWQGFFVEYLAQFTAVDPTLNSTFADNWKQAINDLISCSSDSVMVAQQEQAGELLSKYYRLVLSQANELEYFLRKAFPNDFRLLMEFGFDKISKAVNLDSIYTQTYALTALRIAADYSTQLAAVGMPANWLTDFETLLSTGQAKIVDYEHAKRMRIRATTQRVKQYNILYEFWKQVNLASAIVFRDNPVMAALWHRK